jgi:7-carboxy-7-deazaguanine synthase
MRYEITKIPREKAQLLERGELLPLMEQFYTIQGEGYHSGKAAYFIRIGGCDVGCHWCDVKESWDASLHPLTETISIIEKAMEFPAKAIVVTGGEPLQYNLDFLTAELKKNSFQTFIETSGAFAISGTWDWICLSPKKTMPPQTDIFEIANELKVIVYNQHDFIWAEENAKKVNADCKLFLQPEWSKRDQMMPLITHYVMRNPKWMVSLQTHKYMNIP